MTSSSPDREPRTATGIAFAGALGAGPFKPASREWFAARVAEIESEAAHEARTAALDAVRKAQDRMVDEVREGTRTLSAAYRPLPGWPPPEVQAAEAQRWSDAVDRVHLAVAAFANEVAAIRDLEQEEPTRE